LAGDALDQRVGADLVDGARIVRVALGSRLAQRSDDGHPLSNRQQRREVDHRGGCRSHGDPSGRLGLGGALCNGCVVDLRRQGSGATAQVQLTEGRQVVGKGGVHLAALLHGQARRLLADDRGTPLGGATRRQVGHGVRQLATTQGSCQSEVPRSWPPRPIELGNITWLWMPQSSITWSRTLVSQAP